ncbi:MAG: hypothetical protein AB9903_08955 [Vulcanimicrobiota bacterium]
MKNPDVRAQILKIIDTIPEYQLHIFLAYIQALQKTIEEDARKMKAEMIIQYMQNVPEEDCELSSEERDSIERAREGVRRGEHQSLDSVMEELDAY